MAAVLLLLLSLLSLHSHSFSHAESVINIDCGSNRTYNDTNNVTWVGDEGFVTTGETMEIQNEEKPFNTLRYFPKEPNGTDNCYNNIPVKKGEKNLVRTMFYHGKYDGKLPPPIFVVLYNKAYCDYVIIKKPLKYYFSEVIFAPVDETISICLLSPPSHNPFISSIEVNSFDTGMYDDLGPNEALIYQSRIKFGDNETLISYPIDPYGRLWIPAGYKNNSNIIVLPTSASRISIAGASNKPPKAAVYNAFSEEGLTLYNLTVSPTKLPVYLALYFSEPKELRVSQKRSFNVSLDGKQVSSDPIVPVFGKTTQVVKRDINASSASQLTFQSTEDSDWPPIINALEVYVILKLLNGEDIRERYKGYLGGADKVEIYEDVVKPITDTIGDVYELVEKARKLLNPSEKKITSVGRAEDPGKPSGLPKKLALGLGIGVPVSLAALISPLVYFCKKGRNSKPESNTERTTSSDKLNA